MVGNREFDDWGLREVLFAIFENWGNAAGYKSRFPNVILGKEGFKSTAPQIVIFALFPSASIMRSCDSENGCGQSAANGGVLFLDEVGDLGLDEQAMLLRADGRTCQF